MNALKRHCVILALLCMVPAAVPAIAEAPKSVNVPAGELIDALESLAKQCGVDIIYPSSQLKGRRTQGVNGMLPPTDAFKRLLEGTPLVLREEGGALPITQAASASMPATVAQSPEELIPEVEIEAERATLSALRAELEKLEDQFYTQYNRLNSDHQYDVTCRTGIPTGSHVERRICRPVFVVQASEDASRGRTPQPGLVLQGKTPEYQKNMVDLVAKHPELLELVKERNALAERYEASRKQKLNGKIAVWD
ncbi:MAG: STN domain-containing protein [Gammaproteobacteria bacterium]